MKVLTSVSFLQRFCTQRFNVSGRGMLRKSDFISKLATENERPILKLLQQMKKVL